jgi:hypothetical protein
MKFGFVLPHGDARTAADLVQEAESAGWDGFFVWDAPWGIDPWVSLAAVAMVTERIRIGTMLTPVSRRRPWKLASETATLDNLSNGRLILAVGLGAVDTGFAELGEQTDLKIRAELLDEGLEIVTGLWRGQPFNFAGKHYQLKAFDFNPPPPPVQQPRIPIWVVGLWPRMKSMRRVLLWDGLIPQMQTADGDFAEVTIEGIRAMKAFIDAERASGSRFDIVMEGETPGDKPDEAAAITREWSHAGVTWWLEASWDEKDLEKVRARLQQGPPSYE